MPDLGAAAITTAQFLLVLGAISVAVLLAARWLSRRATGDRRPGGPRRIQVLESQTLGPRQSVFLVRVDAALVMVAAGDNAITALPLPPEDRAETAAPVAEVSASNPSPNFLDVLRRQFAGSK